MTLAAQIPLDLGHRAAMGCEDFLVAPSNAEAVAWLDRWPSWPAPALTLYGPDGCGKTHLGHVWRAREEALFHLYNLARDSGGHLLLLSRRPPSRWRMKLADLRSRIKAAPAVGVEAPDDALLAAVLVKLFADRQLRPGMDLITYLLARMERSLEAAGRVVAALDRASLAAHRPLTVPLAREVLAGLETERKGDEDGSGNRRTPRHRVRSQQGAG